MKISSLFAVVLLLAASTVARADILLSYGVDYTQDFSSLISVVGPSTLLAAGPDGWFLSETGSSANTTYQGDSGSTTSGNTMSYGVLGVNPLSDRALGTLQTASLVSIIGARFVNNNVNPLTKLAKLSYTGEQWRRGTSGGVADDLVMQISVDATSLTTGSWTTITGMGFVSPHTATSGAKDGNAAGFNTFKTIGMFNYILPGAVASGAAFWIRWTDTDRAGTDDGLAIDNFTIQAIPEPSSMALCGALVAGMFGFGLIRRRKQSAR